MNSVTISIFLFVCLLAGPASAFLVAPALLPVFLIFSVLGILTSGKPIVQRFAMLAAAPLLGIAWGAYTGDQTILLRSLRWLASLCAGVTLASELGMSRAAYLLNRLSERVKFGKNFLESLALLAALAGPFSKSIREKLSGLRQKRISLFEAIPKVLSGIETLDTDISSVHSTHRMKVRPLIISCFAWCLFLSGIAGVPA